MANESEAPQATAKTCRNHPLLIQRVDDLTERLKEERTMREKALDDLKTEFRGARQDIVQLKVDMAKFGAMMALLLVAIQVAIKFIP